MKIRDILFVMIAVLMLMCSCSGRDSGDSEMGDVQKTIINHHMAAEFCSDGNLIYFLTHYQEDGGRRFMYYDKDADICGLLCGKPECTHDTSKCNAIAGLNGESVYGLGLYREKLYWISDSITEKEYRGRYLYRMNLDGTGREEVRRIVPPDQRDQRVSSNMFVDYVDDYLIIGGGRHAVSSGTDETYLTLRAYALSKNADDQILYDEKKIGALYFCSVGTDIYYAVTTQKLLEDGEEWVQKSSLQLRKYDLLKKTTKTLFDSEVPFCPWEFTVSKDQIIFSTISDMESLNEAYVLDLSTGKFSRSVKMGDEFSGIGAGSNVDQEKIICYSFPSGNQSRFRILVKNFKGEVVADHTNENTMMSADRRGRGRIFAGSDTESLYYFFKDTIDNKEKEWLMAYPIGEGEPKLIYSDAKEEEKHGEENTNIFKAVITLDAEKIGEDYYIDSFDDLEHIKCYSGFSNNTEYEFLDFTDKLFVVSTYEWLIFKGGGEKFPAETTSFRHEAMLSQYELYPANFVNGKAVLRYECTGMLNGEEISSSDEITLYVRSEMNN